MNIHFSNVNFSSSSGPNSFACRLANELTLMGHSIVKENKPYDSMLIFIEPSSKPRAGARIVQRLDGIWFKPEQFNSHNVSIKWAYDNCHDVIWQSEFDRKMTSKHWGDRSGKVIHNGADIKSLVEVKEPQLVKIRETYEKIFVCSSRWHRQKRLKENVELFLKIREKNYNSCLIVMGDNVDYHLSDKDIFYTGLVAHDLCMQVFSAADWMIHLAWLDHCPNVVVEALSQNCPIICSSSGGTQEIVRYNGVVLPEKKFYNFDLLDYDDPYELSVIPLDLPNIKVDNSYLDIRKIAEKYTRVLEGIH